MAVGDWHCYNSSIKMRMVLSFMKCFSAAPLPVCFLGVVGSRLRRNGISSSESLSSVAWAGGRDGPARV
jgi:hypothetical protein